MIRVAINGFGRIGRQALKVALDHPDISVVAINDLSDAATLAHLFQYDTAYGHFPRPMEAQKGSLNIDGISIALLAERDPAQLPWKELRIDIVLECTGRFTDPIAARAHIQAGAKRVLISAPAKGEAPVVLMGVHPHPARVAEGADIVSNGSCTTNCMAPVLAVLDTAFGVEHALVSTVHAATADQNLQDGPHTDLRRARAAMHNIVPTTTGAAETVAKALPSLAGRMDGVAWRVPVLTGSVAMVVAVLKKPATVATVNEAFTRAARTVRWQGIVQVNTEPLVSSDIVGSAASAIVDLPLTRVVGKYLVHVAAWYDNEWAYANRLIEMARALA